MSDVRVLTREDVISLVRIDEDTLLHEDGAVTYTWHLTFPSWTDSTDSTEPLPFIIRECFNSPDSVEDVVEAYAADDEFFLLSLIPFVRVPRENEGSVEAAVAELIDTYNSNQGDPQHKALLSLLRIMNAEPQD